MPVKGRQSSEAVLSIYAKMRAVGREVRYLRIGAHGLNVARLLAAVADTLGAGLGWALAREMADLAA